MNGRFYYNEHSTVCGHGGQTKHFQIDPKWWKNKMSYNCKRAKWENLAKIQLGTSSGSYVFGTLNDFL